MLCFIPMLEHLFQHKALRWRIDRHGCAAGVGFEARALTRCKLPDAFRGYAPGSAFGLLVQSEGQSPDLGHSPNFQPQPTAGRARASHPAAKP